MPLSPAPASVRSGTGPGGVIALVAAALVTGLLAGFFLGRTYERDELSAGRIAPPTTVTTPTTTPPGDTIPQQPATPPGTELAPATIGAFDDPVPFGQAYVLGLYEIEVLDADLDAWDTLRRHEPSNPDPGPGRRHVLVRIAVRYTDASGLGGPAGIPFFVSDGTTEWHAFADECGLVPDDLADAGLIQQGEEVSGNVCFTVPDDAAPLRLATDGFAGPVYFAIPG